VSDDRLAVVVVAYDSAEVLPATLAALGPQLREGDELVVVDNGPPGRGSADVVRAAAPGAVVDETGANLGFAAGCNRGAAATSAPLLLFLNPDARPLPGALDALRRAAADRPAWGAWQALVVLPGGERVNTAGGVVHYLGFGWAGGIERPVASVAGPYADVAFPSGAALVVRRGVWDALGGFDDAYFMYGEDLDLGLRLWLGGHGAGVAARARVEHDYDFAKGDYKWFLLERNRWRTVVAVYPGRLLLLLLPALLVFELALLPVAAAGGWLGAKGRAQRAVLGELPALWARRRRVQRGRAVGAAAFAAHLTASLDSQYLGRAARIPLLARAQAAVWAAVLRML
jgi:GT2 family glycosyltransferase